MSETKINLTKEAFKNYKKHFIFKSSLVSLFGLLIFACLILAYLSPITLLLSIPFVILPYLLAFLIFNSSNGIHEEKPAAFFRLFPAYFSSRFFGSFRFWVALLKVVISYLVIEISLITILYFCIAQNDPSFMSLIEEIKNAANNKELFEKMAELQGNPTYILISNIATLSSSGVASVLFIDHVLRNSLPVYYNLFNSRPMPMKMVHEVNHFCMKKIRGTFWKEYFGSFWFVFLVYLIGFAGASILGIFVFRQSGPSLGIISIFGGTLLMLYLLPYCYDALNMMSVEHLPDYLKAFVDSYKKTLNKIKAKNNLPLEEIKKMDDSLVEIEKSFEKKLNEKDKKENNPSNDK